MIVQKFGGTSVGNLENITKVVDIVVRSHESQKTIVVLSAMSSVTNLLIKAGNEAAAGEPFASTYEEIRTRYESLLVGLPAELSSQCATRQGALLAGLKEILDAIRALKFIEPRVKDLLVSFGERLMCATFPYFLRARGVAAEEVDARKLIVTDDNFGNARVLFDVTNEKTTQWYRDFTGGIPVVTGYIAATKEGMRTTLDRGGSDYTATIVGGALGAELVEIWTDVDGAMTADPRVVPHAVVLPRLSYAEAAEMAYFGAKVLHPLTLLPVRAKGVPVMIKNTFHPDASHTVIVDTETLDTRFPIKSVATRTGLSLLNAEGFALAGQPSSAGRIFGALARDAVNVVMISQASSEQSVCCVVNREQCDAAVESLMKEFDRETRDGSFHVSFEHDVCVIALVGDGMVGHPGVSGRLFSSLGLAGVNIRAIAQGSSERNISAVIRDIDREKAIRAVHEEFIEKHDVL